MKLISFYEDCFSEMLRLLSLINYQVCISQKNSKDINVRRIHCICNITECFWPMLLVIRCLRSQGNQLLTVDWKAWLKQNAEFAVKLQCAPRLTFQRIYNWPPFMKVVHGMPGTMTPFWRPRTTCILWLRLSHGSPSNNRRKGITYPQGTKS